MFVGWWCRDIKRVRQGKMKKKNDSSCLVCIEMVISFFNYSKKCRENRKIQGLKLEYKDSSYKTLSLL